MRKIGARFRESTHRTRRLLAWTTVYGKLGFNFGMFFIELRCWVRLN